VSALGFNVIVSERNDEPDKKNSIAEENRISFKHKNLGMMNLLIEPLDFTMHHRKPKTAMYAIDPFFLDITL
jgi:hypothetical protein